MRNREVRRLDCAGPIRAIAPQTDQPFIILRNGEAVLRADWDQPVEAGDLLAVVLLPQGAAGLEPAEDHSLGGDGGLRARHRRGDQPGAVRGRQRARLCRQQFCARRRHRHGRLGPHQRPDPAAEAAQPQRRRQHQLRLGLAHLQPRRARQHGAHRRCHPEHFGRLLCYPDFAAAPYVEYAGNEQYLYQLMCVGTGEYDIEAIRVEDTAIDNFEEIEYEVVLPYNAVNLFPTAVSTSVEVSGQEATTSTTLGPFTANAATTVANRIAVDVVCSRGLYYANDSGGLDAKSVNFTAEAREIDDDGVAVGSWFTLGTETISAATTTPQRRSYSYGVPDGRYEVRLTRNDSKDTNSRAGHELDWAGLRAYLTSSDNFGDVTLVAMKMRATNNLSNQAARKINMIATRKLPVWDGSAWSPANTATRSPAWAIAYCAKRIGLPDSRIDLAGLLALDAVWSARGDSFDGRFDQVGTWWDSVSKIAQAGRAKPFMQGSILYVWRDQEVALPVAAYGMRNIVRGSFAIEFVTPTPDTADAVEVSLLRQGRMAPAPRPRQVARQHRRQAGQGGSVRLRRPRPGVPRRALHGGSNRYRRTVIKFETEMEGFIPSYGDLIAISHDLPQWGQGGEIVSWDAGTKTAILSEPLTWKPAETHYIGLRRRDGSLSGPYTATIGISDYHVVLATAPDFTPYVGRTRSARITPSAGRRRGGSWPASSPSARAALPRRHRGDQRRSRRACRRHRRGDAAGRFLATAPQFTAPVVTGLIARPMPDDEQDDRELAARRRRRPLPRRAGARRRHLDAHGRAFRRQLHRHGLLFQRHHDPRRRRRPHARPVGRNGLRARRRIHVERNRHRRHVERRRLNPDVER